MYYAQQILLLCLWFQYPGDAGLASVNYWVRNTSLPFTFFWKTLRRVCIRWLNINRIQQWSSGSYLFFDLRIFFIIDSISFLIFDLFRFSISSYFSLGKLFVLKNLFISTMLSISWHIGVHINLSYSFFSVLLVIIFSFLFHFLFYLSSPSFFFVNLTEKLSSIYVLNFYYLFYYFLVCILFVSALIFIISYLLLIILLLFSLFLILWVVILFLFVCFCFCLIQLSIPKTKYLRKTS